jgi:hypothetical protein
MGPVRREKRVTRAVSRKAHVAEFTCFLQAGLDDYLRGKIAAYARMLESL